MPLTFAHPAAVLPLRRSGLIFSALVIGSMAPDFQFFLNLSTCNRSWHNLQESVTGAFPAAMMVFLLFHRLMFLPLLHFLPESGRASLINFHDEPDRYSFSNLLRLCASLAIGILSHTFWDGLTHPGGFLAAQFPLLAKDFVVMPLAGPMALCHFLQHGSTLFGLALLVNFFKSSGPLPGKEEHPHFQGSHPVAGAHSPEAFTPTPTMGEVGPWVPEARQNAAVSGECQGRHPSGPTGTLQTELWHFSDARPWHAWLQWGTVFISLTTGFFYASRHHPFPGNYELLRDYLLLVMLTGVLSLFAQMVLLGIVFRARATS